MPHLKNIAYEEALSLTAQTPVQPGQAVSKTLAQNQALNVALFSFAHGKEIGMHDSNGDAMVTVLEGTGRFTVDGREYLCCPGKSPVMPMKKPHAVYAEEDFKMLLPVVFLPEETGR